MKTTTVRGRWEKVCRVVLCAAGPWMLSACAPAPEATELSGGIWMLEQTTRTRDGVLIPCRPMLMQVEIAEESVFLGTRLYPCESEKINARALTMRRDGSSLFLDDVEVGTLAARRMDIVLPTGGQTISWNLDRPDAPWQELLEADSKSTLYQARLTLRPDSRPVPIAAEYTGVEENEVSGRMHAATLAIDDAGLEYVVQNEPGNGHFWALNADTGTFIYAPYPDFAARDQFTFLVHYGEVFSDAAPVGITLTNTQDPPIAKETTFFTDEDTWIAFPTIARDPDGDPLTAEIVTQPAHGNVTLDGQVFTYTPEPNFQGIDSFTYRVYDGLQYSNIATLQIIVNSINDSPTVKDVDLAVTAGSATPLNLEVHDIDSGSIFVQSNTPPTWGVLSGAFPYFVYQPSAFLSQGKDSFEITISDELGALATAKVNVTISPGTHECTMLSESAEFNEIYPAALMGSRIYYRTMTPFVQKFLGVTEGTPTLTYSQWIDVNGTFGFDNSVGGAHRTTFFRLPSTTYFTTSKTSWDMRLYIVSDSKPGLNAFDIPKPGNDVSGEPAIGDAYVNGDSAYFSLQWPTATSSTCQVWKTNSTTQVTELVRDIPSVQGSCFGIWALAGEQYMFVGSKLMRVPLDGSPLVLVKDLGNAAPTDWMVVAGGKLFFQTRTTVGGQTQIDLWCTDGTPAGTTNIKTIETAILEFDIFSPVAFGNKLYFAHRKSLWSSDGTTAGTNIVKTIPVTSVVGNGAIGTISSLGAKLYFLATSDTAGREPWVSDGTTAGTNMLRDIHVGTSGSSTASTNPAYFHEWNGMVFFSADDGASHSGLWLTDGTPGGTAAFDVRPMKTILGILGNRLVYFDGHFLYAMALL